MASAAKHRGHDTRKPHIYLVEGLVESLDYTPFDIKYSGAGHPAYHPECFINILNYGNNRQNTIFKKTCQK